LVGGAPLLRAAVSSAGKAQWSIDGWNGRCAEADITPALAANLVREQISQRVELPIVAVDADGWDNTAFRLGDELSVRLSSAECYVARGGLGLGSRPRCRWPAELRPGVRPRSDLRPQRRAVDGRQLAFVAYWHSGFVALDVTDPGDPVLDGHTVYGRTRTVTGTRRCTTTPASFFSRPTRTSAELRSGHRARLWLPADLGLFEPRRTRANRRVPDAEFWWAEPLGSGDYTIHNPMLMGTDVYISWSPTASASSTPAIPGTRTRWPSFYRRLVTTRSTGAARHAVAHPQVWGVFVDEATGLVYASDMNTGLWILRRTD
jgi:hypothetical protein